MKHRTPKNKIIRLSVLAAIVLSPISSSAWAGYPLRSHNSAAEHPMVRLSKQHIDRTGRYFGYGYGDGYHGCYGSGFRPGADLPPKSSHATRRRNRWQGNTYYDRFDNQRLVETCDGSCDHHIDQPTIQYQASSYQALGHQRSGYQASGYEASGTAIENHSDSSHWNWREELSFDSGPQSDLGSSVMERAGEDVDVVDQVVQNERAVENIDRSPIVANPIAGVVHRLPMVAPRTDPQPEPETEPEPLPEAVSKPRRMPSVQSRPCRLAAVAPSAKQARSPSAAPSTEQVQLPKQIGQIAELPVWAKDSDNAVQVNPFAR